MTSPISAGGAPQRLMRQVNDRVFCELLAQHGPLSRPQLAKLAGLSSPATLKVIERLEAEGFVVSDGFDERSRPGPKAAVFALAPSLGLATAVELRGNVLRIAHSPLGSTAAERHDVQVESDNHLAEVIVESVRATIPTDAYRHHTVAIALPGAIDPTTGDVLFSTELPRWVAGTSQQIRSHLGRAQVLFDNEVNYRAIAERVHGVAGPWEDYVLLSLGGGVGAAVVLGGRVHKGAHGAAGEVGFMRIGSDADVPFQDEASAWMLAPSLDRRHTRDFALLQSLADTEPLGSPVWDAIAERIVPGVVNLATTIDPGLVILGGETARIAGEPLRAALEASLRASLHWHPPTLLSSQLGDEAVLLGALDEARIALAESCFGSAA